MNPAVTPAMSRTTIAPYMPPVAHYERSRSASRVPLAPPAQLDGHRGRDAMGHREPERHDDAHEDQL